MREGRERDIIHCTLIMGGGWGRVLHLLGSPTGYERGEGKGYHTLTLIMGGGWGRVLHLLGSPTGYERGEGKGYHTLHTHNGRGVGKGASSVRITYWI